MSAIDAILIGLCITAALSACAALYCSWRAYRATRGVARRLAEAHRRLSESAGRLQRRTP